MEKTVLTFEDLDDGGVDVKIEFDPPYDNKDEDKRTLSQTLGCYALDAVSKIMDRVGADEEIIEES